MAGEIWLYLKGRDVSYRERPTAVDEPGEWMISMDLNKLLACGEVMSRFRAMIRSERVVDSSMHIGGCLSIGEERLQRGYGIRVVGKASYEKCAWSTDPWKLVRLWYHVHGGWKPLDPKIEKLLKPINLADRIQQTTQTIFTILTNTWQQIRRRARSWRFWSTWPTLRRQHN